MLEEDGFDDRLVFSDKATFNLTGKVNEHNTRIWGTEHPHSTLEDVRDSPKVNVFCTISNKCVYEPFFFKGTTVNSEAYLCRRRRRHRLKGIHSRSDTNRTGVEGLSFYYHRLLYCLNQMLAVVLLNQHRVLSSKTIRPHAPCCPQCIGHAVRTWSAICSEAPHLQFGEGAIPHLCMNVWNRPTPVRRRLSLTQAARGKLIPTGLAPVPGTKPWSLEAPSQYSVSYL